MTTGCYKVCRRRTLLKLVVASLLAINGPFLIKYITSTNSEGSETETEQFVLQSRERTEAPVTTQVAEIITKSPKVQKNKGKRHKNVKPAQRVGVAVTTDKRRYVCPTFGPNLGNLMFLYASNYGFAYENGMTLLLNKNGYIFTPFKIPKPVKGPKKMQCLMAKGYHQKEPRIYQEFQVPSNVNLVRLTGYLESWKYFSNSFADIRGQFIFREQYDDEATRVYYDLVSTAFPDVDIKDVTSVGIHIRRGDKVTERLPLATKDYIEKAKAYFMNRYENVLFVVATNPDEESRTWCTDNVIFGSGKSVFTDIKCKYVDMAILTKCDHMIMSVGTYGWWAAFLNGGEVLYYDYYTPQIREDYMPPEWIGVRDNTPVESVGIRDSRKYRNSNANNTLHV